MSNRIRPWLIWPAVWFIAAAIALSVVLPSESFKNCVHEHKNDPPYQELHQRSRVIGGLVVRAAVRLRLGAFCAAHFADQNERPLSAFAAIALAVFTFYLWHATRGLRRFAELQGADMRQLVRLARANALASMRGARAARTSAIAALQHAQIAERSLIDLERPYIFIAQPKGHLQKMRMGQPVGGYIEIPDFFNVTYGLGNYGRTPAVIRELYFTVVHIDALQSVPDYSSEDRSIGEQVLAAAAAIYDYSIPTYHCTPEDKRRANDGTETRKFYVYGFVRYSDVFGNKYIRGHGLLWLEEETKWTASGGDAYNYDQKEDA